jgi:hypothetical protein
MRIRLMARVNNREFGLGTFIKKEPILSLWNYSLYLKILWFTFGITIAYGNKYQQWSNRN